MAGKTRLPAETVAYVKGITRILGDKSTVGEKPAVGDKPAVIEARTQQPSRVAATYFPAEPAKQTAILTRPDGSSVTIDGTTVNSIRASLPDEFAPGVQTVISMGGKFQGVREDPATVSSLLKRPIANV